jgi:hypothetical protein
MADVFPPCCACQHPNAVKARKEMFDTFNVEYPDAWKGDVYPPLEPQPLPLTCCRRTAEPWEPPELKQGELPY